MTTMPGLRPEQVDALLRPISAYRVGNRDNRSYLQSYDVRRRLTNIFGFGGWSGEVIEADLIYEVPAEIGRDKKPGFAVAYRVVYRLTIHATGAVYTEAATGRASMGEAVRGDAHDFALKTAESQALKRCAINLGDQFGLGLYNSRNKDFKPIVREVLGDDPAALRYDDEGTPYIWRPEPDDEEQDETGHDHVDEQLGEEQMDAPVPDADDAAPATPTAPEMEREIPDDQKAGVIASQIVAKAWAIGSDPDLRPAAKKARLIRLSMEAVQKSVKDEPVTSMLDEAEIEHTVEQWIQLEIGKATK